jgi:hypothetical protein
VGFFISEVISMSFNSWNQTLITQQIDGTALASSTSATSLLPGAAKFTLPANLLQIGMKLRVRAAGRISTVVTTPGTLTLDIRFGSVVAFNGGAMNLNTTAQTNAAWMFEADLTCRAIGSSTTANMFGVGKFISRAIIGSAAVASGGVTITPLPDTSPAAGTGFDSTAAQVVDFFGTWSVSNAANSIRCDDFELILAN